MDPTATQYIKQLTADFLVEYYYCSQ